EGNRGERGALRGDTDRRTEAGARLGVEALAVRPERHLHAPRRSADAARADLTGRHVADRPLIVHPCPVLKWAGRVEIVSQRCVPEGAALRRAGRGLWPPLARIPEPGGAGPVTAYGGGCGPGEETGSGGQNGSSPCPARPEVGESETRRLPSGIR